MPTQALAVQQDGGWQGWTSIVGANFAYQAVDELVADGDTSYIILPRFLLPAGRVSFPMFLQAEHLLASTISVLVRAKTNTGNPVLQIGFAKPNGGAVAFSASTVTLGAGYVTTQRTFSTSPFTGAAWTASELAGLEACVQMENSAIGTARITQIFGSITYATAMDLYPPEPQMAVN